MRTILFFVDDYSGGAGNVVQLLANYYYENSIYQPVVALLNPHTEPYKLNNNILTIEYNLSKNKSKNIISFYFRNIYTIKDIVKSVKPDCIISFLDNINTNVCMALYFSRLPIIVSERSNPLIIRPVGKYRYLRKFAYRRANLISIQCPCFAEFMPSMLSKMIVTPNPVLCPAQKKQSYELGNTIQIVTCARLEKIKQMDMMIEVIDCIRNTYENVRLTIYGEGPERNNLETMIRRKRLNDFVKLPGKTRNVYEVLSNADIYIMTSKQEGFPNALCEAMAIGLPVVAFECHFGLRDIINSGTNGFLVSQDNVAEMADCVNSLIMDNTLRARIGENAKEISNLFNVDRIALVWRDAIESIIRHN